MDMKIPAIAGKVNGKIYIKISNELKDTEAEGQIIREVLEHYKKD
jgi:hypothetical protein